MAKWKFTRGQDRFQRILIASLIFILLGVILLFAISPNFIDYRNEIGSVGISLITAGFLAITLDTISLRSMSSQLNDVLSEGITEMRLREFGIEDVVLGTPFDDIFSSIDVTKNLTIIQTWSPSLKGMLERAQKNLSRGGSITIYLLHPDSIYAKQRSLDLDEEPDFVKTYIKNDISIIRSLYRRVVSDGELESSKAKTRIVLKLYSSLPTCAIYKTDNRAWLALFWLQVQSALRMNFVIEGSSYNDAMHQCDSHIRNVDEVSVAVDLSTDTLPPIDSLPKQA